MHASRRASNSPSWPWRSCAGPGRAAGDKLVTERVRRAPCTRRSIWRLGVRHQGRRPVRGQVREGNARVRGSWTTQELAAARALEDASACDGRSARHAPEPSRGPAQARGGRGASRGAPACCTWRSPAPSEALVLSLGRRRRTTADKPFGCERRSPPTCSQRAVRARRGCSRKARAAVRFRRHPRPARFERADLNVEEPERVRRSQRGGGSRRLRRCGRGRRAEAGRDGSGRRGRARPVRRAAQVAEYAPRWDVPLRSARRRGCSAIRPSRLRRIARGRRRRRGVTGFLRGRVDPRQRRRVGLRRGRGGRRRRRLGGHLRQPFGRCGRHRPGHGVPSACAIRRDPPSKAAGLRVLPTSG